MTDQIIKTGDEYVPQVWYMWYMWYMWYIVWYIIITIIQRLKVKKQHFCHSYWVSSYRSRNFEDNHQKSCCNGEKRGQNFPETLRKGTVPKITLHHKDLPWCACAEKERGAVYNHEICTFENDEIYTTATISILVQGPNKRV